jgi:hypothetical protein
MRGNNHKNRWMQLVLDVLKFIGISGHDRVPYYYGIFQPEPE